MIFRIITQLCSRFQYTLTRINIINVLMLTQPLKLHFLLPLQDNFVKFADQKTLI